MHVQTGKKIRAHSLPAGSGCFTAQSMLGYLMTQTKLMVQWEGVKNSNGVYLTTANQAAAPATFSTAMFKPGNTKARLMIIVS